MAWTAIEQTTGKFVSSDDDDTETYLAQLKHTVVDGSALAVQIAKALDLDLDPDHLTHLCLTFEPHGFDTSLTIEATLLADSESYAKLQALGWTQIFKGEDLDI